MTNHPVANPPADLLLIFEGLQQQLDDLQKTVQAQQEQIAYQAARISALERS